MDGKDFIKVGRGHDSEVRITDISVSRCHALIKRSVNPILMSLYIYR
jgi:pSer/pThr/pTyr-binding forkhead associated (FHA) protein